MVGRCWRWGGRGLGLGGCGQAARGKRLRKYLPALLVGCLFVCLLMVLVFVAVGG